MDLRKSTAYTITIGPCLDASGVEYTGLVIGDISIRKADGASSSALASAATLTHDSNGLYKLVGIAGNVDTVGRLQFFCNKATYQIPIYDAEVLDTTVYDVLYGTTALASTTNITAGTITTTTNLTNAPTSGDFTSTMKTSIGTAVAGSAVASVTAGVTVTTNNDKTGYTLTVTPPTAAQNAAALMDLADGVETSITPRQALRLILASAAGKLSGAATTTITIRNVGDSKDRITATVDASGNRSTVTTDAT